MDRKPDGTPSYIVGGTFVTARSYFLQKGRDNGTFNIFVFSNYTSARGSHPPVMGLYCERLTQPEPMSVTITTSSHALFSRTTQLHVQMFHMLPHSCCLLKGISGCANTDVDTLHPGGRIGLSQSRKESIGGEEKKFRKDAAADIREKSAAVLLARNLTPVTSPPYHNVINAEP